MSELKAIFEEAEIPIDDAQCEKLLDFCDLLLEKNKVMNLTAITEKREVFIKHFLDSCILGKYLDFNAPLTVADLGTGAGFPGIPLKILYPKLHMTLIDSLNKRVLFLMETIEKLELTDVTAIHGRAEEVSRDEKYREQFDLCVSRAVANLSTLSEYCLPLVRVGSHFVAYKTAELDEELAASKRGIALLGGRLEKIERFALPDNKARSFVFIEKCEPTPATYPRKAGKPAKSPL